LARYEGFVDMVALAIAGEGGDPAHLPR
jgi:hypothetical protein